MQIDHGIPLTPHGHTKQRVYPFNDMRAGDSFFVSGKSRSSISGAVSMFKRRHPGWNFATRPEGDGVRVWCLATPQPEECKNAV